MTLRNKLLPILTVLTVIHLRADDGAASIAAGGLVVMKQEPRITMAKEVLQISASKVIVDYDFRNDSDENVTTEIAFPVADYAYDTDRKGSEQGFDDFRLWVDRVPARFHTEARAFVNGKEYTQLLASMHVDVASYGHGPLMGDVNGHRQPLAKSQDIQRLTAAQREQLGKVGLIALDWDDEPLWHVRKKYYWQQTFPAHKIVHIRHEYTPVLGSENSVSYGMGPSSDPNMAKELKSFCIDGHLRATLEGVFAKDKNAWYSYVDFILTTANTWRTPIEDFTLIVERPHWKDWKTGNDLGNYVSFCWDGPITKIDADHFTAHAANFIPRKEFRVGFFSIEIQRF
jgi:hypothetical protein